MERLHVVLRKIYRGVGSSRAKRLLNHLERNEWDSLLSERLPHPTTYRHASVYWRDAITVDIVRKLLLPGDTAVRRQRAVETFWHSERQCHTTNLRLSRFINRGPFTGSADIAVDDFISRWRKEVDRVLGKAPEVLDPRFSNGSTLSDKGKNTTIPDKMSSVPTVYDGMYSVFRRSTNFTVLFKQPQVVRANTFFTVNKDSEKDRGCCVEASGAVILQLAVDQYLKDRYKISYGVVIEALPKIHQKLAKLASILGHLATIDLSNASDTVAKMLVKLLVSPEWWTLLNSLRAKLTEVDGQTVYLEKFSSMGNGFTFMIETILFQTLCRALGSTQSSVFGDDIIVETELANDVLAALGYFGFTPNSRKTFCEGPFRESCGGDYFEGVAVRPHFLKTPPDEPQHWVALANGLRRADIDLKYFKAAWRYCIDQVPTDWRVFYNDVSMLHEVNHLGEHVYGDAGFFDPSVEPKAHVFQRKEPDGTVVKTVLPGFRLKRAVSSTVSLNRYSEPVQLAAMTLGCTEEISQRKSVLGYKTYWLPAHGCSWLPDLRDRVNGLKNPGSKKYRL